MHSRVENLWKERGRTKGNPPPQLPHQENRDGNTVHTQRTNHAVIPIRNSHVSKAPSLVRWCFHLASAAGPHRFSLHNYFQNSSQLLSISPSYSKGCSFHSWSAGDRQAVFSSTKDGTNRFHTETRQTEPMATKKQTTGMTAVPGTDTKCPHALKRTAA